MATMTKPTNQPTAAKTAGRQPKPLPAPNSDFYGLYGTLKPDPLPLAEIAKNKKGAANLVDKVGFDN